MKKPSKTPAREGFVGLWFHSFYEDGTIRWQGQVVRLVARGRWAVQLYSWLDGGETNIEFVDKEQLESFRFYPDHLRMVEAWIKTLPPSERDWAIRSHRSMHPEAFEKLGSG